MLHCFTAHGLTIKSKPGARRVLVTGVGVAEEDHLTHVPGVVYEGPMSYIINTAPPPTAASERAFITCVHNGFGGG